MSWADIKLLYIRELRSAMRERSIVINSILIPIFLYPAILWLIYTGISFVSGQTEGFSTRLMLKGEEALQVELKRFLDEDKRFEVKVETDALQAMSVENLDLIVELLPARDEGLAGNFQVKVFYDESKDRSKSGLDRFTEKLNEYREKFLEKRATELGITEGSFQQFTFESENVATKREMGQFVLGLILPFFIIVMLALGGFYPAIDSTAGEREKSTWETIITTAASRTEIVLAKYLYVSTMSLLAGMLNLAAMLFSMKSVLSPLFGASTDNFSFEIPFGSIPVIVVCSVLLSLFISAGMMMLASFARTFKDGQSLVSPFYVAIFLPVSFLQLPGIEFSMTLAAIPILNVAMVFREAISGIYHWPQIVLTIVVEVGCIVVALWMATKTLEYEDFILGSYDGSVVKFLQSRIFKKGSV